MPTAVEQMVFVGVTEQTTMLNQTVPMDVVDEFLRNGGGAQNWPLHMAILFQEEMSDADRKNLMVAAYGNGYTGIEIDNKRYSLNYNNLGIVVNRGENIHGAVGAAILSWDDAYQRISELFADGNYHLQIYLDGAFDQELKELAQEIIYLYWDINYQKYPDYPRLDDKYRHKGFPEVLENLSRDLQDPEFRQKCLNDLSKLYVDYVADRELMRFHYHKPDRICERLNRTFKLRELPASEKYSPAISSRFIVKDEIESWLCSRDTEGRKKTYTFFRENPDLSDRSEHLRKRYGIGGSSSPFRWAHHSWVDYDGKGLKFTLNPPGMTEDVVRMPWPRVARMVESLINEQRFLLPSELEDLGIAPQAALPTVEATPIASEPVKRKRGRPRKEDRNQMSFIEAAEAKKETKHDELDPLPVPVTAEIPTEAVDILDVEYAEDYLNPIIANETTFELDGRTYLVDRVNEESNSVNVQDISFAVQPIAPSELFKVMPLDYVRSLMNGAAPYKNGDTVVLDDGLHYTIENIGIFDVQLHCDQFGNISRAINRDEFDLQLARHSENKMLLVPLNRLKQSPESYLESAKHIIDNFCQREYHQPATFDDLSSVGIAHTTLTDDEIPVQVNVNLVENRIERYLENDLVDSRQFASLREMIEQELYFLSFEDLISFTDEQLQAHQITDALQTDPEIERAKKFIQDYLSSEFNDMVEAEFDDLTDIPIAYTSTEDGSHDIQVTVDLEHYQMKQYVDNELRNTVQYLSLEDINDNLLSALDFDEITSFLDEETPTIENPAPVKAESPVQSFTPQNYILPADDYLPEGAKGKFAANVQAIQTLNEIELRVANGGIGATPEEQAILAKYVGWGGLPMAFDDGNNDWKKEYAELKSLLSPEEYSAARSSTLNAHYTSPVVINAVYEALGNMGLTTGNILEPSCGIGNFFGCLPAEMSQSKLYGVELDSLTGRIARQLYPKANIQITGFEKTNFPDRTFDAVVGNVPFGNYQVADTRYDRHKLLIHDYFIAKSLDQVRPGGVVAVVTSSGTMDKRNSAAREYFAQRADLLGAIRLPNDTFRKNTGASVVTDILFLQVRDHIPLEKPSWVNLAQTEDGHSINQYFAEHPEMVLGKLVPETNQYGKEELTVEPYPDRNLADLLHEAVSHIQGTIPEPEIADEELSTANTLPADPTVQNYSYTLVDDQIYFRIDSQMYPKEMSAAAAERVKGLLEIRDTTRQLLQMQLEDFSEPEIQLQMQKLNTQYDRYTSKHGLINAATNRRAFAQDSSYYLLSSLEMLDDEGNLKRKADIFSKRTIKKAEAVTSVDTAVEALSVSMGERACVDLDYMAGLCNKSVEDVQNELKGLIFKDPITDRWQTADEYLSGNVRKKLKEAQTFAVNHPEYAINAEYLQRVQPPDLSAAEIDVRLGVNWIEPELINQFMKELLHTPRYMMMTGHIQVNYSNVSGEWNVTGKSVDRNNPVATVTYGTDRANAYRLLEDSLNQRSTQIYDTVTDVSGNERRVINKNATLLAQQKQEALKEAFKDWVFKDPERRSTLVQRYNERFNSIRPREYDGQHLQLPGMNPMITLRTHQKNVVARMIYGGNCLVAHAVGAGKTISCIAAAMESKRLGLCQKSLFVVPNHLLDQWGAEILRLYPSANVLVATKKDFEPANRKRFCSRIATGDYDIVVIGHTQFEKIPLSEERQRAVIERQIADVEIGLEDARSSNGPRFTIKQMESTIKKLRTRLEKLATGKTKDSVVTMEELGVDRLFVDESQNYKNLYHFTKMNNVAGIAQTDAQKSSDMYAKCQYMDEITGGKGVVFATGTPISNSMTEMYTLMRYLQSDMLRDMGLQHFDNWAAQFGETVTAVELTPEGGGYRAKTRFAKFYNLPELISAWKECADVQTSDMLALPVPKAIYEDIVLKPSDTQKEIVASLGERAEIIHSGGCDPSEDNMLRVTSDGRKLALDQRLINPLLPDAPVSKVNSCVDKVFEIWQTTAPEKLTQVIFCDLSTPKADGRFNVYDDIKNKLIAKGVPENEIAFIHDANNEAQKAALFARVRNGQVRVILGSTSKMGAGTNIQDRLYALHHLDTPWRPSDLEQQEGRIIRQGNKNSEVRIFRYVVEQTFDSYMWQILESKQKFIGQVMTSKSPARSCEDTDEVALKYAEVKALASGNPLIKEKTELDAQVTKLRLLKANFKSQHYQLEDNLLRVYPVKLAECKSNIAGLTEDIKTAKANLPADQDHFSMIIGTKEYIDRKEAGTAIIAACAGMKAVDKEGTIGQYAGFNLNAHFDAFWQKFTLTIKGKSSRTIDIGNDPSGNITRINNALQNLERDLAKAQDDLIQLQDQIKTAKEELERPFPQESELAQKQARLQEVNAALDLDKKDHSATIASESKEADAPKRPSVLSKLQGLQKTVLNAAAPTVAPKKDLTL